MNLTYNIKDKPKFGQVILFALQQLLAIMAATIAVPNIIGNGMSPAAALFGAGAGTIIYLLFTKFSSPVFLGSSFAFLGSMAAAFGGAASMEIGYAGLLIGAIFAGLVYVVIAVIVKFVGVNWINKLMPAVIIGPTVAIIGLSLAGNAVGDLQKAAYDTASVYVCLVVGLVTLAVTMLCSVYGKGFIKMIPFVMGILAGYALAAILTAIGDATDNGALMLINFGPLKDLFTEIKFTSFLDLPDFTFVKAFEGLKNIDGTYIGSIAIGYVPVALVVFAEHLADHKNISSIIESDLLENPGLHRTLLGDGIGSMVGSFFGGCPNTTYGESIGCVAISGNASIVTILTTAIMAMAISFIAPFSTFLATIPSCVMGGVCMALYGFIAVSGLKMLQKVDLEENRNLFTASVILIAGIGGLSLSFAVGEGKTITITTIACALILGILTNVMLGRKKKEEDNK